MVSSLSHVAKFELILTAPNLGPKQRDYELKSIKFNTYKVDPELD